MGNITETVAQNSANPNLPQASAANQTVSQTTQPERETFPNPKDKLRLSDYEYFNHLMMGEHYEAFSIRVDNTVYGANYGKLRYVAVNFAGLLTKVSADMLFSEPISLKMDDDGDQDWVDNWSDDNRLNEKLYEASIDSSSLGDACFKLRVGKRNETDDDAQKEVILEAFTPAIFFPTLDGFNVQGTPNEIKLQWTFQTADKKKYLRQEIHTAKTITNKVFEMEGDKIGAEVGLGILGIPDLVDTQETGIDKYLIFHIPNPKTANRFFGISDYYDLDKLFFALNNRITKVDNILDKHSDPILMIPDGVLDENGQVKREALNMIEVPEGNGSKQKPEYIVWNANLEAAFSQIEKLVEFFMMTAEITPDILGMGQGMNDSGRALKFKLMRTIAKAERKKLYFDRAIKEIVYVAQLLADKYGIGAGEDYKKFSGKPQRPEVIWQDGLPIDDYEDTQLEIQKLDAGIQTKKAAIMNLDDIDEDAAEEKLEEIDKESKLDIKNMQLKASPFGTDEEHPNGVAPETTQSNIATPAK